MLLALRKNSSIVTPFGDTSNTTRVSELELRICPGALLHATQHKRYAQDF